MDHHDHVRLIQDGIATDDASASTRPIWADIGAGDGAFTLALADVLGTGATIYAVDRERSALQRLERAMRAHFPATTLHTHHGDFTRPLDLPPLDGIVMANALHFVREKRPVVARLRAYLKPGGRLVLVEYDTDRGNHWVPHPLAYPTWESLARASGFATTRLLATVPSRFLGRIYSALSMEEPALTRRRCAASPAVRAP